MQTAQATIKIAFTIMLMLSRLPPTKVKSLKTLKLAKLVHTKMSRGLPSPFIESLT